jgi:hypothetical protein
VEDKGWSYGVTHRVPATFHSVGAFTRSAEEIYKEMRRPEVSPRGLASAIQMNQFFINRAGKALDPKRREEVQRSIRYLQAELKYRNALSKGTNDAEQLEKEWKELIAHIDITGEPVPAEKQMTNKYLEKVASLMNNVEHAAKRFAGHVTGSNVRKATTEYHKAVGRGAPYADIAGLSHDIKTEQLYRDGVRATMAGTAAGAAAGYAAGKHEKKAGVADAAKAAKAGARKFSRAFQGVDVADMKDLLKRTPTDRDNLAARVDLGKRLGKAKKEMYAARGAAGAAGAAAVGGGAVAAKKKD